MTTTQHQQITEAVNQYPWKYWGTLTTKGHHSPPRLHERYQRWIRRLSVINQAKINHLHVIEESPVGRPHIHCQLGDMNVTPTQMLDLWVRCGGGVVNLLENYDPDHGSGYTVKNWISSEYKGIDTRRMKSIQPGASP